MTMTLARFQDLLDLHGADLARWPQSQRAAAERLLAADGAATAALAQGYPTRPVTLVVPFSAGGPTDTIGRLLAERMTRSLGQTVVVENVLGAGGTIANAKVMQASPDGYTIEVGNWSAHVVNGAIYNLASLILGGPTGQSLGGAPSRPPRGWWPMDSAVPMNDAERFVVEVRDNVTEALIEHEGHVYMSPPQDREQALELVALLLGHPTSANCGAEQLWRQAIAGGQRSIKLRCVK